MPSGIVHFPSASIPHISTQQRPHLDPLGSLTPTKSASSSMNNHQNTTLWETDRYYRSQQRGEEEGSSSTQLFSWSSESDQQQKQATGLKKKTSVNPPANTFGSFFPTSTNITAKNSEHDHHRLQENQSSFGIGVTKDMIEQIKATRAQLNLLTQQQQHQQSSRFLNQQQQGTDDGSSFSSTFQHLNTGKISSSWDVVEGSPAKDDQNQHTAWSPSPEVAQNNHKSKSPSTSSSRNRFSVSPLPSQQRLHEQNNHNSVGFSPSLSRGANNDNDVATVVPDASAPSSASSSSNSNNNINNNQGKRPPWNYRAGKAALAKDADPAATASCPDGAPSNSMTASNRFDTPNRKLEGEVVAKKPTSSSSISSVALTDLKPPLKATTSPSSLNSSLSKIDHVDELHHHRQNQKKVQTRNVVSATTTRSSISSPSPTTTKAQPQQQKLVTSRTFFPSPLRRTAEQQQQQPQGKEAKTDETSKSNKQQPQQQPVCTAVVRPSTSTPSCSISPRASTPVTKNLSAKATVAAKRSSTPTNNNSNNNNNKNSSNNNSAKQQQQNYLTEEQVNAVISQAISALEQRLQRQEVEMRTLRTEHSSLQIAHNALREQHSDLVDFVGLQLNELRGVNDGTGSTYSCGGRSDTTDGTQRALALIDAEIEGSTPPSMMAAMVNPQQQQPQHLNLRGGGGNAKRSPMKRGLSAVSSIAASENIIAPGSPSLSPASAIQQHQQQRMMMMMTMMNSSSSRTPTRIVTGSSLPPSPPISLKQH